MKKRARRAIGILSVLVMAGGVAAAAEAACVQKDIVGTWQLHGINVDGAGNTVRCLLKVKPTGRIPATTKCFATSVDISGNIVTNPVKVVMRRPFKVKPNCTVTGSFKRIVNESITENGIKGTLTGVGIADIESAQMSKSKEVITMTLQETFSGELTSDVLPKPLPIEGSSVDYFTMVKL